MILRTKAEMYEVLKGGIGDNYHMEVAEGLEIGGKIQDVLLLNDTLCIKLVGRHLMETFNTKEIDFISKEGNEIVITYRSMEYTLITIS